MTNHHAYEVAANEPPRGHHGARGGGLAACCACTTGVPGAAHWRCSWDLAASADDPGASEIVQPFKAAMQEAGWIDGKNYRFDYRFGGGDVLR